MDMSCEQLMHYTLYICFVELWRSLDSTMRLSGLRQEYKSKYDHIIPKL